MVETVAYPEGSKEHKNSKYILNNLKGKIDPRKNYPFQGLIRLRGGGGGAVQRITPNAVPNLPLTPLHNIQQPIKNGGILSSLDANEEEPKDAVE